MKLEPSQRLYRMLKMLEREPEYRDLQVCRTKGVGQHTEKLWRETTGEANHIWGIWADEACSTKHRKASR